MPVRGQMEATARVVPMLRCLIADRTLAVSGVVLDCAFADVHCTDVDRARPEEVDPDVVLRQIEPIHHARCGKIADGSADWPTRICSRTPWPFSMWKVCP